MWMNCKIIEGRSHTEQAIYTVGFHSKDILKQARLLRAGHGGRGQLERDTRGAGDGRIPYLLTGIWFTRVCAFVRLRGVHWGLGCLGACKFYVKRKAINKNPIREELFWLKREIRGPEAGASQLAGFLAHPPVGLFKARSWCRLQWFAVGISMKTKFILFF